MAVTLIISTLYSLVLYSFVDHCPHQSFLACRGRNYDANIVTISSKQTTGFEIRHLVLWLQGILLSVILHLIILF